MATLAGNTIASTYPLLLKIDSSGIDGTLRVVEDGDATDSALLIATNKVEVKPGSNDANAFEVSQADGTAVFTINTMMANLLICSLLKIPVIVQLIMTKLLKWNFITTTMQTA